MDELYDQIKQLLESEMMIVKLLLATKLGHPAVEGVDDDLYIAFGEQISEDKVKQRIGKIVKEIMEAQGYIVHKRNVMCASSDIFTSGSVYLPR